MRYRRNGLTLVELVVGICALGTLLSISLPAIQWGQEAADRNRCQLNLRMIGLASHEYDDAFGELPPYMGVPENQSTVNGVFSMGQNYQLTYSLTQLLDFVGYKDLTDQVDPFAFSSVNATIFSVGYSSFGGVWLPGLSPKLPGIEAIVFDFQVPEFRCPADAAAPTNTVLFGPHPTNTGTAGTFLLAPGENEYSVTNYAANTGALFVTDTPSPGFAIAIGEGLHGPIRSRRSDSVDTIPDGASNVILFGESLGQVDSVTMANNRRYSMAMGGLACGAASTYVNINTNFGTLRESSWTQFASGHPNVVNFVFADASVKSLNRNIRNRAISSLCGVADGDPVLDLTGN